MVTKFTCNTSDPGTLLLVKRLKPLSNSSTTRGISSNAVLISRGFDLSLISLSKNFDDKTQSYVDKIFIKIISNRLSAIYFPLLNNFFCGGGTIISPFLFTNNFFYYFPCISYTVSIYFPFILVIVFRHVSLNFFK